MTRIGVRAFKTIGDLFELDDNLSVGELDLRIANSFFDLENVLLSSLARFSRFVLTTSATAAANPNAANANPKAAGQWDSIFTSEGDGIAIPADHAMIATGISVFVATPANFTSASLLQQLSGSFELPLAAFGSDFAGQGATIDGRALQMSRPPHYGFVPFEIKTRGAFNVVFETNVSGNTDVTLILDAVSGPRALFGSVA